jgi:hypothetical protein
MRVTIHVGPHKTGSTYIQNHLMAYRSVLLGHGIYYPTEWTSDEIPWCHVDLVYQLQRDDFATIAATLARIRARDCKRVILSCEGLSTIAEPRLRRLGDLIDGPVEIVSFLRSWTELLSSHLSEDVRHGGLQTLPEFCTQHLKAPLHSHILNYAVAIERYVRAFGRDALILMSFNNIVDQKRDLFGFFLHELARIELPPLDKSSIKHASLPIEMAELLRILGVMARRAGPETGAGAGAWQTSHALRALRRMELRPLLGRMQAYRTAIAINEAVYPFEKVYADLHARYHDLVVPIITGDPRHALFHRSEKSLKYIDASYLLDVEIGQSLRQLFAEISRQMPPG